MKPWITLSALSCALCLSLACGDDDDADENNTSGGNANASGGAPGDAGTGGSNDTGFGGTGGKDHISCEPPAPPDFDLGASGSGGAGAEAGLSIVGSYADNFMGQHVVTNSEWTSGTSVFHISRASNHDKWLVAQNDEANMFSPCLWSRFDWVVLEDELYYCQTVYNGASEQFALGAPAADAADLSAGCGGFSWTELTRQ